MFQYPSELMTAPRLEMLFPTPVVIATIKKHKEYKNRIVPSLTERFKDNPNLTAPWSELCHTWQVPCDDNRHHIWDDQFNELIYDFLNYLYGFTNQDKVAIDSWLNVHDQNMYQESHEHLMATVSGIYYLQLDEGSFPATFLNPLRNEVGLVKSPSRTKELAQHTFPNTLDIKEGNLILFPSHLTHLVRRSESTNLRVSYSFNVRTQLTN